MRHVTQISRSLPAKAFTEDHPNLIDSLVGFLKDPLGVIRLHLDA